MTTYQYSPTRGGVENIETTKGGTTHQELTYAYYPDGMVQSITSAKAMETWNYLYDDLNRLEVATNFDTPSLTQSFTYNDIGNITYNSQIGTYHYTGTPHAVATVESRSYQYDLAGRMTSRNGTVIQWNGDGKPSSIGNVGFTYDGIGERLKKVSGGQTTRYVGGNYEIAHDGTVTKYLHGGKQVGTNFFVHHRDHLGSIQAITDAAGVEVRRQDHTPFGDQHFVSGSHQESKGWIGEREEETELLYLNARYYDPEIARFISPDPIARLGQRLDRYAYAVNNPINAADPSGRECVWISTGQQSGMLYCPPAPDDHSSNSPGGSSEEKAGNILDKLLEQEARREERERRRAAGELGPQQPGGGTGTGTGSSGGTGAGTDGGSDESTGAGGAGTNGGTATESGSDGVGDPLAQTFGPPVLYASIDLSAIEIPPPLGAVISNDVAAYGVLPVTPGIAGGVNLLAGTRVGSTLGIFHPVKVGGGGLLQPYSAATGRYLSHSANSGLAFSQAGRFSAGFASGLGAAHGAPGSTPVGTAGRVGYAIGLLTGSWFP